MRVSASSSSTRSVRAFVVLASVSAGLLTGSVPMAKAAQSSNGAVVSVEASRAVPDSKIAIATDAEKTDSSTAGSPWIDEATQAVLDVGLVALVGSLLWAMGNTLRGDLRKNKRGSTASIDHDAALSPAAQSADVGVVLMASAVQTPLASGAATLLSAAGGSAQGQAPEDLAAEGASSRVKRPMV